MHLLTRKPTFYIANVDEGSLGQPRRRTSTSRRSRRAPTAEGALVVPICAALEAQIAELDPADRPEFLASAGLEGARAPRGRPHRLRAPRAHHVLHRRQDRGARLDDPHAASKAPQAAGVIHTDFEKGFIKAEVIWWEDFVKLGGEAKARETGKLGIEGKEYVVRDGDVMHFRFNV